MLPALLLAALPQSAEIALSADRVDVPMSHANRCVVVSVEIGGEPYTFQVDTYASIDACIDDDLAAALELEVVRTTINTDGHTRRERDIVEIPRLRLGGVTWTGMEALVDDYGWLKTAEGRRVDGLIGFPAFRDVLLTFDYPEDRLVVERGALGADEPHTMPFEGGGYAPDIWLELGGERRRFGIDTGMSGSMSMPLSDADELPLVSPPVVIGRARTVYSDHEVLGASVDGTLDLAGHALLAPHASFTEGRSTRLLGYLVLRPFAVTFDQRGGRVRFVRPALPAAVRLTGDELDGWVGTYRARGSEFAIERGGDELFLRKPSEPRRALIPLSPDELVLRDHPVRFRLAQNAGGALVVLVVDHPERPPVEAHRIGSH